MNPICNGCSFQEGDGSGGVQCSKARYYTPVQGYGEFKGGSTCLYDIDLKPIFEARTGEENEVKTMSSLIERLRKSTQDLEYEKSELARRLTSIVPEAL